jgi:hypothetical protein
MSWYDYALIRVVPRVDRGEFLNVGVVLFARTDQFLRAVVEFDRDRLLGLDPAADCDLIDRHLASFLAVAEGNPAGGEIAALPHWERFHWLTAPRSTLIQTSPVHSGHSDNLEATLEDLLTRFVR